jgi:hypothetical protein
VFFGGRDGGGFGLYKNWWLRVKQAEVHIFKMPYYFVHKSTGLKYSETAISV